MIFKFRLLSTENDDFIRDAVASQSYPICTLSEGSPPVQILLDEIFRGIDHLNDADTDENFPGDDEPIEE
jgi:hypothetical protein